MTAHGATGQRKTSMGDQMTFGRVVHNSLLAARALTSVFPTNTANLKVVQENERGFQKVKTILSDQQEPARHVNFESQFLQKFL